MTTTATDGGRDPPHSEAATITILLSRSATTASGNSTQDSSTAKLCVVSRRPHKRHGLDDRVRYVLENVVFLDDRRSFANLDALLTRLAPVCTAYVACTEGTGNEGNNRGGGNGSGSKKMDGNGAAEASSLVSRLVTVLESRNDVSTTTTTTGDVDDDDCDVAFDARMDVRVLPPLSRSRATSLAESTLRRLLGGENSSDHLAYRGDRRIAEEPMVLWCLGCHFSADGSYVDADIDGRDDDDDIGNGGGGNGGGGGAYRLVTGTMDGHLMLDRTAAEAIHLLPPRIGSGQALITGGNAGNNSLYGVLNRCKTRMGSRTLEVWLRQPLVDLRAIQRRQDAVARLVEDSIGRDRLREEGLNAFRGLDIDRLGRRLIADGRAAREGGGIASTSRALESLYKLHLIGDKCLPPLLEVLEGLSEKEDGSDDNERHRGEEVEGGVESDGCALTSVYRGLAKSYKELGNATLLAERVLDFDRAPRDYIIRPELDAELADVREELNNIEDELGAIHSDMNDLWAELSGKGNNQVKLEDVDANSNTSCVWQFRLANSNDIKLLEANKEVHGVRVHRILKNGVYFSTKELEQLGTKKRDLMTEYQEKQRDIVNKCMEVASTFVPVLERCSVLLAELDVISSLAHVAAYSSNGYCRPEMTDGEEDGLGIKLKAARHPCVELQDDMNFIANDFNLVFGSSSFLLVTGPNMGGKSTYIRSLGAIITMAQIGSFVPCASAKINIIHHILARVGAGDYQDRGISTFMAEMLEASSILRTSTKRSLIIIDELGRGTSTFDGYGLAKAISEHIVQKIGCMTVFATHFHELTALEEQEASVANSHVSACSDGRSGLTFLYEVRPGPCLESFGIQVAEMANMPALIITDAKRKAKQLENFGKRTRLLEDDPAATDFLCEFKELPVNKMSNEEKRRVLFPLLAKYVI